MENMVYDLTWLEAPLPPLPRSSALQKNRIRTVDDGGGVSREGGGGDGLFHGVTKMGGIERGRSDDGGNFGCLLCGLTQDNGLCLHCSLHGKGKGFFFLQAMCGGGGPFYSPLPRYFHPRLPRKRKKVMQVCWGGDTHSWNCHTWASDGYSYTRPAGEKDSKKTLGFIFLPAQRNIKNLEKAVSPLAHV